MNGQKKEQREETFNMKKKHLTACLAAGMLLLLLAGCGKEKEPPVTLAVVTDGDGVDDLGVNQAIWQSASAWGEENGEKTGYYIPENESVSACRKAIDTAVDRGAEFVICHGEEAGAAVYQAQRDYRDVKFLLFDAEPHKENDDREAIRGNTRSILFDREEAGFLAGYAAVKEGYTSLGYYGGADTARAKEYGAGFLQGAQTAAEEDGLEKGSVEIRYQERKTDAVSPEFLDEVEELYRGGCQAVFTDGSSFEPIVRRAAERVGGRVIGVVTDESQKSSSVVISAVNKYDEIVTKELAQNKKDSFEGGKSVTLGTADQGVGLTTGTMQMQKFTAEQESEIIEKLKKNKVELQGTGILKEKDKLKALKITEE